MKIKFSAVALIPFTALILLRATVHAQPPTKSIWDGVYSEAQAARGKALYSQECASCHGGELTGGEMAPPLAGGEFMAGRGGPTIRDPLERVPGPVPHDTPRTLG